MKKNKQSKLKYLLFGIIFITGILIDQFSKILINNSAKFHDQGVEIIKNFFYIRVNYNSGAAWGIFAGNRVVLLMIPVIVLIIFGFLLYKANIKNMKLNIAGLSLMMAGAVGNLIDRIRLKEVIDFLEFHFGSYQYPTFNIADSMLVIGVILFSIDILFFDAKRTKLEKEELPQNQENE